MDDVKMVGVSSLKKDLETAITSVGASCLMIWASALYAEGRWFNSQTSLSGIVWYFLCRIRYMSLKFNFLHSGLDNGSYHIHKYIQLAVVLNSGKKQWCLPT